MAAENERLRNGLAVIARAAGLHYYGGAFDPEHMRVIANYAIGLRNGEANPGDLDEAPPSVLAEEAVEEVRAHQDLLGELSQYVDWRWLTGQVGTEQKERWADAVEQWSARHDDLDGWKELADRWWLCPTCGVDSRAGRDDGPHEHCRWAPAGTVTA